MATTGPDIRTRPLILPPPLRTIESGDGRQARYLEFDLLRSSAA
ncbi:MAG: hypothetical protein ACRDPV_13880 [Gaiellaceae bacterium]